MACNLNKFESYDLANVKHDVTGDQYVVRLSRPPVTCPGGQFVSKSAELVIDANSPSSLLSYTTHPVITVTSESMVQNINVPHTSAFGTFLWVLFGMAVIYGIYRFVRSVLVQNEYSSTVSNGYTSTSYRTPVANTYAATGTSGPAPSTVIVNNSGNGGGGDFIGGMLVGSMLSDHGISHHETVVEHITEVDHVTQHEHESDSNNYSSDNDNSYSSDDSSSSYSSSGSDSYSSDSSSSYSSDSGSSYSSDSGSSDSGSSFSSDS